MTDDDDELLHLEVGPELIFGLIAPIGVDLELISDVLEQALKEMVKCTPF
jgi:hypothetical protein